MDATFLACARIAPVFALGHLMVAVAPVVHKEEVGVVAVQAGQVPLAFLIHDVLGREATLGMERGGQDRQTALHLHARNGCSSRWDK